MNVLELSDITDERLGCYASLKSNPHTKEGIFIVESKQAVKYLLQKDFQLISCLTTHKLHSELTEEMLILKRKKTPVYLMEEKKIQQIIGFSFHQGIMLAVKIPDKQTTEQTVPCWHRPHFLVALNGVHDPQNMGMIIRNVAAFGADTLIIDDKSFHPYYRKVVRASMGSIFNITIAFEGDIIPCLMKLKSKFKTKIVVTSPHAHHTQIKQTDLTGNICIVFGNEATGASEQAMQCADIRLRIPIISDHIESLNVACASAILMHEAAEQRKTLTQRHS